MFQTQKKFKYQSLCYRPFCGNRRDVRLIYHPLASRVNDEHIVQRLMNKLTKEVVPHSKYLSTYVRQLIQVFSGYSDHEPATASYYTHLLSELRSFLTSTAFFQTRVQNHLISFLENIASVQTLGGEGHACYTEDILSLRQLTEHALDQLNEMYDRLYLIVIKESQKGQALMVVSRIGEWLRHLMAIAKNIIFSTQDILRFLKNWEVRMSRREMQEIYN
jgi:hypothetical protein